MIFTRKHTDTSEYFITFDQTRISASSQAKLLGITFDSKFTWTLLNQPVRPQRRNVKPLILPASHSTFLVSSFLFISSNLWNEIPLKIRNYSTIIEIIAHSNHSLLCITSILRMTVPLCCSHTCKANSISESM